MFESIGLLGLSRDVARHAAQRQYVTAQNVANADTPGYKAKDVSAFRPASEFQLSAARNHYAHIPFQSTQTAWSVHEVDAPADPNGNTVSLDQEVMRSVEAERTHSRAVTIYQSSLDVLRSALGRR